MSLIILINYLKDSKDKNIVNLENLICILDYMPRIFCFCLNTET